MTRFLASGRGKCTRSNAGILVLRSPPRRRIWRALQTNTSQAVSAGRGKTRRPCSTDTRFVNPLFGLEKRSGDSRREQKIGNLAIETSGRG